jgi:endonuclease YncB( thermonuclease family)
VIRYLVAALLALATAIVLAPRESYVPMVPPEEPATEQSLVGPAGWRRVEAVVDGGTIEVDGVEGPIRLAGVVAPGPGERCGPEATALVARLAPPGSYVFLEAVDARRAYVRVPYAQELWTLQELLLGDGLARMIRQPPEWTERYYGEFARAEEQARRGDLGLWSEGCEVIGPLLGRKRARHTAVTERTATSMDATRREWALLSG